jgi:rSAM/selenodomain-associated transferase 1
MKLVMTAAPDVTLCIFVKEPRAGAVKTRLAATIGAEAAARLARAFFLDTIELAQRLSSARVVVALSGEDTMFPEIHGRFEVWSQGDGDLGARMERILRRALEESPRALAIGTDSPGLPLTLLENALKSLGSHDAVMGPADDGGFYLLGLTACPEGLLASLPWSADDTRARTLSRLHERGLSVELLDPWFDVDVEADLDRLRSLLAAGTIHAPKTSQILGIHRSEEEP